MTEEQTAVLEFMVTNNGVSHSDQVTVTITPPAAGPEIEVDKTTIEINEGGTATLRVKLTAQPSVATNVTLSENRSLFDAFAV